MGRRRREGAAASSRSGDDHLGPGQQGGPGLDRSLGHQAVEVVAGDGVAVAGEIGVVGPLHLEGLAEAVGPQAAVLVRSGQGLLEAHVGQLAHGPRGEAVAAGLDPGEVLLLHHHHVPAGVGQPVGARGSGRAAADDDHVVHRSSGPTASAWRGEERRWRVGGRVTPVDR